MRKALFCCSFAAPTTLVFVAPAADRNHLPSSGHDQIGIDTEPDFDGPDSVFTTAGIGTRITVHIVLTGLSAAPVQGSECAITWDDTSALIQAVFAVNGTSVIAIENTSGSETKPLFQQPVVRQRNHP